MQRLSSWFEQLPLRRRGSTRRSEDRNRSGPHKQQSKSAAPRLLRYSVSAVQNYRHRDHSVDVLSQSLISNDQPHVIVPASWNRQETVTSGPCRDNTIPASASLSQSFLAPHGSTRKNIRTNPWISRGHPSVHNIVYQSPKPPNELLYASMDRSSSLRVKSLGESTCSSGYGSQDSSPESSVHSPEWQPSVETGKHGHLEDKAVECNSIDVDEALGLDLDDDTESEDLRAIDNTDKSNEHIYHELEGFDRFSLFLDDRACSSDFEFASSSSSSGSLLHSPRHCSSPVYANPHQQYGNCHLEDVLVAEYPNTASSFTYIPCANYRPAPEFRAPPPPPPPARNDFEQAELDFLSELDAQIAELQVKSVAVRQLVDKARERRDARVRNAQLYLELSELRRMKWVLHNHFELVL